MEQQNSQNTNTARDDIEAQESQSRPQASDVRSDNLNELSENLLDQTQNVLPGPSEYEKMRKTCPMIVNQIWSFLYIGALLAGTVAITMLFFPEFWPKKNYWMLALMIFLMAITLFPAYWCVVFWVGLYTKNFSRIEKSVDFLKYIARFYGSCTLASVVSVFSKGKSEFWFIAAIFFAVCFGAFTHYVTAFCVKKRMMEGDSFKKTLGNMFEPLKTFLA